MSADGLVTVLMNKWRHEETLLRVCWAVNRTGDVPPFDEIMRLQSFEPVVHLVSDRAKWLLNFRMAHVEVGSTPDSMSVITATFPDGTTCVIWEA